MIKMIFTQIWNKRRSNGWLFVELLLVFCLLWYIVDFFFVLEYNRALPSCRDINHTWCVTMAELPSTHAEYIAAESDSLAKEANFDRVLDRIRNFKGVESMALITTCSSPGGGGYCGMGVTSTRDTSRTASGMNLVFDPRTDYFKVFRITCTDGRQVTAKDFDWADPKAIVLSRLNEMALSPGKSAVGMHLGFGNGSPDELDKYIVKGVVGDVKRFDYLRPQGVFYSAQHLPDGEIAVRSNASISDKQFFQSFKPAMEKELRIGNYYLVSIKSYKQLAAETDKQFGMDNVLNILTAMMLFFLVNIMLCVMGTFWYRIRVRREEIGLRMAMGSTHAGIRTLLFMEGLALLALVVLPAMFIEFQFVHAGMIDTLGKQDNDMVVYLTDRTGLRFLITNAITWLILSVSILLAIAVPANKASKMAPADALHYE